MARKCIECGETSNAHRPDCSFAVSDGDRLAFLSDPVNALHTVRLKEETIRRLSQELKKMSPLVAGNHRRKEENKRLRKENDYLRQCLRTIREEGCEWMEQGKPDCFSFSQDRKDYCRSCSAKAMLDEMEELLTDPLGREKS